MTNRIRISRQDLYDKIWSMPVSRVAKEFNLSDVGLAKICRRYQIPRPSVGYWAQVRHGQTPKIPILPPAADPLLDYVDITVNDRPVLSTTPAFKAKSEGDLAAAEASELTVVVPDSLDHPHPLVQSAIAAFKGGKPEESGVIIPHFPQTLDLRVTSPRLDRAFRIWSGVITALEALGYTTTVRKNPPHSTIVIVLEEEIPVYLMEEINRKVRDATPEEQAKWRRQKRYETKVTEYTPTGRLSLCIDVPRGFGLRQKWSDTARGGVEDKLAGFVHGLVEMAVYLRADRIERAERERKWEEERLTREDRRRQYKEEKERFDALVKDVDAWHLSQKIRAFAEALRAKELHVNGTIDPESPEANKIDWIVKQADRLDPLKVSPHSILDDPEPSWW